MQAVKDAELVSVEDYLAGEPASEVRHEYLGGVVYAMAGASEVIHQLGTTGTATIAQLRARAAAR